MTRLRGIRLRLAVMYAGIFAVVMLVLLLLLVVASHATAVVHGSTSVAFPSRPHLIFRYPGNLVTQQHSNDLRWVAFIAVGVVVVGLLASLPVGWWLSGRAVRPVEDAFETQRHFIANASHELRTPLTVERTLLQVALADPEVSTATLRATCEELLVAGREQERLLDALLTLAISERGLEHREPVDLALIAGTPDSAVVSGDPALLKRLVANLVDNANQHNVPDGWVKVETGVEANSPFIVVANSGPVIGRDQIEGLFEPFRRLGADRVGERHGLGLSIVRAIADAHGATVTADPLPDGGLRVRVSFPPAGRSSARGRLRRRVGSA
jgi:signal transduction histidine kinase